MRGVILGGGSFRVRGGVVVREREGGERCSSGGGGGQEGWCKVY